MTKSIHIHLHTATRDAGFDESKIKRGEGGKFATTSSGTPVEHHTAASAKHKVVAEANKNSREPEVWRARNAENAHAIAAESLKLAQRSAKAGNEKRAEELHARASHYTTIANQHETGHKGAAEPAPKNLTNKNLLSHLGARHVGTGLGAGTAMISGISKTHNLHSTISALNAAGRPVTAVGTPHGTTELWAHEKGAKLAPHMIQSKAETLAHFGIKHNGD